MPHLDFVNRILKHVKSMADFAIWYDTLAQVGLSGYTDVDTDRKSISRYMVFLGS